MCWFDLVLTTWAVGSVQVDCGPHHADGLESPVRRQHGQAGHPQQAGASGLLERGRKREAYKRIHHKRHFHRVIDTKRCTHVHRIVFTYKCQHTPKSHASMHAQLGLVGQSSSVNTLGHHFKSSRQPVTRKTIAFQSKASSGNYYFSYTQRCLPSSSPFYSPLAKGLLFLGPNFRFCFSNRQPLQYSTYPTYKHKL